MQEPAMVRTWIRLIARLWPAGWTGENAADATVTFIAGPPCEFLRVLSATRHQRTSEPANGPTAGPKCYSKEDISSQVGRSTETAESLIKELQEAVDRH
jgi:hypothetical protein